MVVASDDAPGVGTTINPSLGKKVTINVINVRETGSITLDKANPQVGVEITATLTDGDATLDQISEATWQWYSGSDEIDGEIGAAHIPTAAVTLKVVATYTAKGDTRTEPKTGINVRPVPTSNDAPTFPESTAARSVDENKPAGTPVGDPVTATDNDGGDRGKLTYSVSDAANFSITTSGQLKTKAPLNYEDPGTTLNVRVTATDPSGETGNVDVAVTVNNLPEAPTFSRTAGGPTRAPDWPETQAITEMVANYAATDPETDAADLVWSLTGTDASDFEISDIGVLTFKEMPDYEKPAASNNVYRVTVKVSDGKLSDTRPMTVTVTDVAEGGVVTLSSVQPKVAVELTASLEDSDGGVKDITWQWASADISGADCPTEDAANTWTDIAKAKSDTYTPVAANVVDIADCLRATASYTDSQGEQTAMKVSDSAVIVNNDNRAPMFPDTETGMRSVAENNEEAANVRVDAEAVSTVDPVMAKDPNVEDQLTYTLGGTDAASFSINRESGQLGTKAKLDYEAKNTYMVTVTAADPNGLSDTIDVTIMVTDEDEAPKIIVGGLVVTGTSDINYAENGMGMVATYSAAGPDAADATWDLSGADAGALSISSAGVLTFMASPNYESPADANTDNIYMVMVNANDGTNDAMKNR